MNHWCERGSHRSADRRALVIRSIRPGACSKTTASPCATGAFSAVLPAAQAQAAYVPDKRVSLPRHALIPGLINLHTHASMSLMRGFADDMA